MNSKYIAGFRNHVSTEALPDALPLSQNSPQRCPYGLYAEQLSGTAFTAPRAHNLRSWLYRIRPSAVQSAFAPIQFDRIITAPFNAAPTNPTPMRWGALPLPLASDSKDFLEGQFTLCGNGDARTQSGVSVAQYAFNRSMTTRFFYNADAEMLLIPELGTLVVRTELGVLNIKPTHIGVVPRGVKFQVLLDEDTPNARGYVCENHGAPFELPNLGPIGANGLANSRDFLTPVAAFENIEVECELIAKFDGAFWTAQLSHSPLDVVAWHGNYAPYQYDLKLFNAINSVGFDHCDPSIFTVLTSPSAVAGTANCDFVIFPPRWLVAEHSFRPPWFHRNVMSEFMGLIEGVYDAKAEGFVTGGASLHNCMSAHGPDAETFDKASAAALKPEYMGDTMAFMLETQWLLQPTEQALSAATFEKNYVDVWQGLRANFNGQP